MATIITRTVVCDVGRDKCDNSTIHTYRVTTGGQSKVFTLCEKHAKPIQDLWDRQGTATRARTSTPKVYEMEEIMQMAAPAKRKRTPAKRA